MGAIPTLFVLACAAAAQTGNAPSQAARSYLREEEYRTEAEIMLQGLQTFLNSSTVSQKLEALTKLAIDAIHGAAHIVLELNRDGRIRAPGTETTHDAQPRALPVHCLRQRLPVSIYKDGEPNIDELRKLLGARSGEVALILPPVGSHDIALLCAPRCEGEFRVEDVGFASRFSPILQQALILKEEQEKLIQAARLSALGQMPCA